jgi:hypothetical protein
MKAGIVIYFSILLVSPKIYSQVEYKKYFENINKSRNINRDSTIYYLQKAIKNVFPFNKDLLNLSYNYYETRNLKKSKNFLIKAIEKGWQFEKDNNYSNSFYIIDYDFSFIKEQKNPYNLFLNNMYKENKDKMIKSRKKFLNHLNSKENQTFEVLLQNEKYFQDLRFLFYDKKIEDSIGLKKISKYGSTPNSYLMLELLRKNQFPKRINCARFNSQSIGLLFNHAIADFLNKEDAFEFVNLLWKLVEKGEITPDDYALAYDHYISCFVDSQKSFFGTTIIYTDDGKLQLMEVLDPINLDKIRQEHWLIGVKEHCKSTKILLPKNYEK